MVTGFHAPETIHEAIELRSQYGEKAWYLGGGTDLSSLQAPCRPEQLISLHRLGLGSITEHESSVVIGALCTLQQLVDSPTVPEIIRTACLNVGNRTIRNQATIGGHIAAAHRYASVLPTLLALEAEVETVTDDGAAATVPVAQRIASSERELVTAVQVPRETSEIRTAVAEHSRSANDLAMLTVATALSVDDGLTRRSAIVVGGIVELPARLSGVEQMLQDKVLPAKEVIEAAVDSHLPELEDDVRASARFKRYLAGVLVADALHRAATGEAGGLS